MADEVLKLIVTADPSKASAELKNLGDEIKKVGDAHQKTAQAATQHGQTASGMFASIMQSANTMAQQMAGNSSSVAAGLSTVGTSASEATAAFSTMGLTGSGAFLGMINPMTVVAGAIAANTLAIAAFTSEMVAAGATFYDVTQTMAGRTGETGAALTQLGDDFRAVWGTVPQSANEVSEVVTKLHQRFDLTGESLQNVSRQMLNFARITGTPVKASMDSLVDVMSSWDLNAKDMPHLIDMMTVAFQKSGVEIPKMAGFLENNEAALKQFGFDLTASLALIANLEKHGVNSQKIFTGLNKAAPTFAEAGIDPRQGFEDTVRVIRELDNEHGLLIAKQVFGAKVAVEFVDAIKSGVFDIAEMNKALEMSGGATDTAAKNSLTLMEALKEMKNAIDSVMAPLGKDLVHIVVDLAIPAFAFLLDKIIKVISALEWLAQKASQPVKAAWGFISGLIPGGTAAAEPTTEQLLGITGAEPITPYSAAPFAPSKIKPSNNSAMAAYAALMSRLKDSGGSAGKNTDLLSGKFLNRLYSNDLLKPEKAEGFDKAFHADYENFIKEQERLEKVKNEIFDRNAAIRIANAGTEAEKSAIEYELSAKKYEDSELFKTAGLVEQLELRGLFEEEFFARKHERELKELQSLQDDIDIARATASGRNKNESALFGLFAKQDKELRGVTGEKRDKLIEKHQIDQLILLQNQYDDTFGKIKGQAEGVFDAIFLRGKKGFAGLLDYIKGTFITGLKDMFGNLVATIFTGQRPGGGSGAQGGLFGNLFSGISGLFGGNRQGGGSGGGGGLLGGLLGGGGGIAGTPPFLPARGGFGGIGSLLGIGGTGASLAGIGGGAGGALALPTTFGISGLAPTGAAAAGAGGGGLGASALAFATNPFTIAAAAAIGGVLLYLKLRKTREDKFRGEILRDFAINVPDGKILKQIKNYGESVFGKDADKKRHETLRLDQVQGLLLNYATASGQDPSRLPIYQRFHGGAGRSISFDPSKGGIPAFGNGAYVSRPTLALIGEKGPEYVVPAAQFHGAGGGVTVNAPFTVHMTGSADSRDMQKLFDAHKREIVRSVEKAMQGDYRRGNLLSGMIGN